MNKTTVYLPSDLKAWLRRMASESGCSEADLIREGIEMALERHAPPTPTIPIFVSDGPHFAERVDEHLAGFGERWILVDTSGLLAALDPRQADHAAAARVVIHPQRRKLSPFVLAELDYLIDKNAGQIEELKLLQDVARGVYELEPFGPSDVAVARTIIERYADLRLGLADASIAVLDEAAVYHGNSAGSLNSR